MLLPKQGCAAGCCFRAFLPRTGILAFLKQSSQSQQLQLHIRGFPGCPKGQGLWTCFHLSLPAEIAAGKPVTPGFKRVENTGSGASHPGFKSQFRHFLALQPQASHFHTLWLRFLLENKENTTYFIELLREFEFMKSVWCIVSTQWISAIFIIYPVILSKSWTYVGLSFLIYMMGILTHAQSLSFFPLVILITLVVTHLMFVHLSTQHMLAAGLGRVPGT